MTRYLFQYTITGSTIVEADDLAAAEAKFNEIPLAELFDPEADEFVMHETLVETAPGCFDEEASA